MAMGWKRRLTELALRRGQERPGGDPIPRRTDDAAASISISTLEDLSALLLKAAVADVDPEELCACAMRLSQATGCALMEWDELDGQPRLYGAVGAWEEMPLRPILEGRVLDWAFALGGAPVCACCDDERVRAFHWHAAAAASGLALPVRLGEKVCGALLFTYPSSRVFNPEEVRTSRLVASHAALVMRHRALSATVERQAQRIARLVDDVERMLISLRRLSAQDESKEKG